MFPNEYLTWYTNSCFSCIFNLFQILHNLLHDHQAAAQKFNDLLIDSPTDTAESVNSYVDRHGWYNSILERVVCRRRVVIQISRKSDDQKQRHENAVFVLEVGWSIHRIVASFVRLWSIGGWLRRDQLSWIWRTKIKPRQTAQSDWANRSLTPSRNSNFYVKST